MTTIEKKFDPISDMPKWARENWSLVKMAEQDLAFRCDLFNAKTQAERQFLEKQASRVLNYRGQIPNSGVLK